MAPVGMMLFLLICATGALVQATTGFGFGIVCMAVFPYILPSYSQSIAVCSLCAATMSSMVAVRCFKDVKFKIILPLFVGYSVASVWSIRYANSQSEGLMIKLLGAVLILVSIYFMFFSGKIKVCPTFINGIIAGVIGGIGAGMFGIGGPPVVIYLMSAIEDKNEYRACSLMYFSIGSWYASGIRWLNGIITAQTVQWWMLAVAALCVGTWLGNRIFDKINAQTLRYLVYGFMSISGLAMFF